MKRTLVEPGSGERLLEHFAQRLATDPIEARGLSQVGRDVHAGSIVLNHDKATWIFRTDSGATYTHRHGERDMAGQSLGSIPITSNLPSTSLKLLMPGELALWGRRDDDFTPLLLTEDASGTSILFEQKLDRLTHAALFFDPALGLFTKLVRGDEVSMLIDIRIG